MTSRRWALRRASQSSSRCVPSSTSRRAGSGRLASSPRMPARCARHRIVHAWTAPASSGSSGGSSGRFSLLGRGRLNLALRPSPVEAIRCPQDAGAHRAGDVDPGPAQQVCQRGALLRRAADARAGRPPGDRVSSPGSPVKLSAPPGCRIRPSGQLSVSRYLGTQHWRGLGPAGEAVKLVTNVSLKGRFVSAPQRTTICTPLSMASCNWTRNSRKA